MVKAKSYSYAAHPLAENLEKLAGLYEVGRTLSINQAARDMGISQPSLSRSLAVLERALGVTLFIRGRDGIRLTREGELLHEFAEALLGDVRDMERRIRFADEPIAGRLRVGTYESIAVSFWPAFLKGFAAKYPGLAIVLSTTDEPRHFRQLKKNQLQVVVSVEPPADDDFFATVLYRDRFGIYSAPCLNWGTKADVNTPIIYVPSARDRRGVSLQHYLRSLDFPQGVRYEVDTFEAAKALALEGIGLAILPLRVAQKEVSWGKLAARKLSPFPTTGFGDHRICAVIRKESQSDPKVKLLLRELKHSLC